MAQLVHQLVMDASRRLLSTEEVQKCLLANKKTFVTHSESLVHSCDACLTVLNLHPLATIVKLINQSVCCTMVIHSIIIIIITSTVEPQYNKEQREW